VLSFAHVTMQRLTASAQNGEKWEGVCLAFGISGSLPTWSMYSGLSCDPPPKRQRRYSVVFFSSFSPIFFGTFPSRWNHAVWLLACVRMVPGWNLVQKTTYVQFCLFSPQYFKENDAARSVSHDHFHSTLFSCIENDQSHSVLR
jgi:hypothetical protein